VPPDSGQVQRRWTHRRTVAMGTRATDLGPGAPPFLP
jgi:hypothetical protein